MLHMLQLSSSHASTFRHRGEWQVCSNLLKFGNFELRVLESISGSIPRVLQEREV